MKISEIWVYPIKSLRGVTLPNATLTPHGIPYDRCFMLLKDHHDASNNPKGTRYEPMAVVNFTRMCLFTTTLDTAADILTVTYTDPDSNAAKTLTVPLHPEVNELEDFHVKLHQSPVTGFKMPEKYCDWFSECFGFDVVLIYLGPSLRKVLGNLAPNAAARNPILRERLELRRKQKESQPPPSGNTLTSPTSWLSSVISTLPGMPVLSPTGAEDNPGNNDTDTDTDDESYKIGFADCCPYLVTSRTSLDDVSSRLDGDTKMDITKFRPNLIIDGAEKPFEEDFWGGLSIGGGGDDSSINDRTDVDADTTVKANLRLTSNCVRCKSITVDYSTGAYGTGPAGDVLKKLQKDRRVDKGHPYSPVFGRYAFLERRTSVDARNGVAAGKAGEVNGANGVNGSEDGVRSGKKTPLLQREQPRIEIRVGDVVKVTRWNEERTTFRWPGIGATKKDDLYPD